MVADRFLVNAGCLFELDSGELSSQIGLGPAVAVGDGVVQPRAVLSRLRNGKTFKSPIEEARLQNVRRLEESRLVTMDREILDFIVAGNDAICGEEGRVSAVDFSRQRTDLVVS